MPGHYICWTVNWLHGYILHRPWFYRKQGGEDEPEKDRLFLLSCDEGKYCRCNRRRVFFLERGKETDKGRKGLWTLQEESEETGKKAGERIKNGGGAQEDSYLGAPLFLFS